MTAEKSRVQKKRQEILEAAIDAFRTEGYDASSMDRIAEHANASKRTVYNHFKSKEALFQAVVDQLIEEMSASKHIVFNPDVSLETQLSAFARAKAAVAENARWLALIRVVLGVFVREPALARHTMQRASESDATLVQWLKSACAHNLLQIDDVERAANLFWALASGALFWPQILEGRLAQVKREQLIADIVQTFLARFRHPSRERL